MRILILGIDISFFTPKIMVILLTKQGVVMTKQLVFSSEANADYFYQEARRMGHTVSLPFINHNGQWQITCIR